MLRQKLKQLWPQQLHSGMSMVIGMMTSLVSEGRQRHLPLKSVPSCSLEGNSLYKLA